LFSDELSIFPKINCFTTFTATQTYVKHQQHTSTFEQSDG